MWCLSVVKQECLRSLCGLLHEWTNISRTTEWAAQTLLFDNSLQASGRVTCLSSQPQAYLTQAQDLVILESIILQTLGKFGRQTWDPSFPSRESSWPRWPLQLSVSRNSKCGYQHWKTHTQLMLEAFPPLFSRISFILFIVYHFSPLFSSFFSI